MTGEPEKPGGFKTSFPARGYGGAPVPGAGKCGEDRRLAAPPRAKPPFSFSEEKENAPFDGVREKGSGGGIPGFARNARGACYEGFGLVVAVGFTSSVFS